MKLFSRYNNQIYKDVLKAGVPDSFSLEGMEELIVIVWDPEAMDDMPQCVDIDPKMKVWAT